VLRKSQSGLTFTEIASILEFSRTDKFAMLYRVYIDDSADEKQEFVMLAGALMGTHKQWSRVSEAWRKRLKREGLAYFRSSEYNSLRGEFSKYRDPAKYPKPKGSESAKKLREDLEAILQTQVLGLGCFVNLKEFREVVSEVTARRGNFNPDPFSFAMQSVMRECAVAAQNELQGLNNKVAFVCDDSPNSVQHAAAYANFRQKNVLITDTLGGMVQLDDKKTPALQAADMIAGLAKEISLEYVKSRRKPESLPRLQGVFWKLITWNKSSLLQLAAKQ
jgi:Protein of unknown function (DUF3800)